MNNVVFIVKAVNTQKPIKSKISQKSIHSKYTSTPYFHLNASNNKIMKL